MNRISRHHSDRPVIIKFFFALVLTFLLLPLPVAGAKFCFVQITDTHISQKNTTHHKLIEVLHGIEQLPIQPAFVINTGDLTEFGSAIEFERYKSIIDGSNLRCYHVIGNHDVRWSDIGKKRFVHWLGPRYQSFHYGGVYFIILDSTVPLEQYGHFSQQQLNWLQQELEKIGTEKPIILAAHHPLVLDRNYVDNEFDLLKLVQGYNVRLFLCGHGHKNRHWRVNGIDFVMTQAVVSQSPGFRLFECDSDSIRVYRYNVQNPCRQFDFSIAVAGQQHIPEFKIEQPDANRSYRDRLPVAVASPDARQIDVKLNQFSWKALQRVRNKFHFNFNIQNMAEGNHQAKLKIITMGGDEWLTRAHFQIDRDNVKLLSRLKTSDAIFATPVVDQDMVFIGSLDGSVYAAAAETMKLQWSFQTAGPIVTSPAIHKDTVFVTSADGYCYALQKGNGKLIWKTKAAQAIFGSPVYANGLIIFGSSDSCLHALNSSHGKLEWKFKTNGYIKMRPVVLDGRIFFGSWDCYFYCIASRDGQLIWKQKITDNRYFPAATSCPAIFDDLVIVASHDHRVHAFNITDGSEVWCHQGDARHKPGYSSPLIVDGTVYLGSLSGYVTALDAQSGSDVWSVALPDSIHADAIFDSSPATFGNQVIVGSIGGTLYGINKKGVLDWSFKISDRYIFSSPVVWKNSILVGSFDGSLYKIQSN